MKSLKGIIYAMISSGTFGLIPLFTIPLMGNMEMNEHSFLSISIFYPYDGSSMSFAQKYFKNKYETSDLYHRFRCLVCSYSAISYLFLPLYN